MGSILYELAVLRRLYLRLRRCGVTCPYCREDTPSMFDALNAREWFCRCCARVFVQAAPPASPLPQAPIARPEPTGAVQQAV